MFIRSTLLRPRRHSFGERKTSDESAEGAERILFAYVHYLKIRSENGPTQKDPISSTVL